MQLRTCAGLGSASFDSFPVKELWADCVSERNETQNGKSDRTESVHEFGHFGEQLHSTLSNQDFMGSIRELESPAECAASGGFPINRMGEKERDSQETPGNFKGQFEGFRSGFCPVLSAVFTGFSLPLALHI